MRKHVSISLLFIAATAAALLVTSLAPARAGSTTYTYRCIVDHEALGTTLLIHNLSERTAHVEAKEINIDGGVQDIEEFDLDPRQTIATAVNDAVVELRSRSRLLVDGHAEYGGELAHSRQIRCSP